MAKDPAFLFYSSDFYMGTVDMTASQVGYYIRLLCLQHAKGHLSEALMTATMGGEFDETVACKFLVDENRCYYNERLDEEIAKRNSYTESRRKNLTAKPTHMDSHMDSHMAPHMDAHMEDVNIYTNSISNTPNIPVKINKVIPPNMADLKAYCLERNKGVDPEQFFDFYASKGWTVGKERMKDWQAAVRTWERNCYGRAKPTAEGKPVRTSQFAYLDTSI